MRVAINQLPDRQLAVLGAAYVAAGREKRRQFLAGAVVLAACIGLAAYVGEVDMVKFAVNLGGFFSYISRIFQLDNGDLVFTNPVEWLWGFRKWSRLIWETVLISYVGTLTGAVLGFVLCFLAAGNLHQRPMVRFCAKRTLEFCRSVPSLVFAQIFVLGFGLGPFAGVLAIVLHTTGALGKQFTEIVENIDMKPVEGLRASGAGFSAMARFAVVPQVLAQFATYALLRFEINVREASVMGFVGAGGIGQDLLETIRKFYYSDVSAILCMLIVVVVVIDLATEKLRHALTGFGGRA